MSWDAYVDTLIGYCQGHGNGGALIGIEGGAIWAQKNLKNTETNAEFAPAEAAAIAKCFKSKDFTLFQANGVRIAGKKYRFLRAEDDKIVLAKLKDVGSLTLQATVQVIVIAHTPEGKQQGTTNQGVAKLCDYLETVGY